MRKRTIALLTTAVSVGLMALGGCGRGGTSGTIQRSDSAGVLIVMNSGPDEPSPASASLEYRLGGEPSGPESFYRLYPRQVGVGAAGVIAVLNQQAFQASTFSADGALMGTYGREGGGPGELRRPSSIAVRPNGDVLVYDYEKEALVGFTAEGEALPESRLTVPFHGLGMVGTREGLIVLSDTRPRGGGTVTQQILHLSPTDTVQLGPSVSSPSTTVRYESCGVTIFSQPPLFASDLVWASNGLRTAIASGPEYSIRVFEDTTLVHVVRRDIRPEAVTREVAEREIGEGEVWYVGGQECTVPAEEVIEQRGYGPSVPVIEALAVTPAGRLWVRRRSPGTRERAVDLFDEGGCYLRTLTPPPPFPVAFLPDGRYATIETDSLDVQRLAVHAADLSAADPDAELPASDDPPGGDSPFARRTARADSRCSPRRRRRAPP